MKQLTAIKKSALIAALLSICAVGVAGWYWHHLRSIQQKAMEQAQHQAITHTNNAVNNLLDFLQRTENSVDMISKAAEQAHSIPDLLRTHKPVSISGLGYARVQNNHITNGWYRVEHKDTQETIALTEHPALQQWLETVRQSSGWSGPLLDPYTQQHVFVYTRLAQDNTVVWATQSIEHIAHLLNTTQTQDISYWLLLDTHHTIRYAPFDELEGKTITQLSGSTLIPTDELSQLLRQPVPHTDALLMKTTSHIATHPLWLTAQSITPINATFIGAFSEADLRVPRDQVRHVYFHLIIAIAIALVLAAVAGLLSFWNHRTAVWVFDLCIAITFAGAIAALWVVTHHYPFAQSAATPIFSKAQLYRYLDKHSKSNDRPQNAPTLHTGITQAITNADELYYLLNYRYKEGNYVPTGILVHDISFESTDQIGLVGYVWQRYFDGIHDGIARDFIFPQIGTAPEIVQISRTKQDNVETILWQVSVTLNQTISYRRYPFDIKQLRIELRHKEFDKRIVLVPDLDAYYLLNPTSLPGVSPYTHLANWSIVASFFGFSRTQLNTNFGIYSYGPYGLYYTLDNTKIPSLTFNIMAQRDIWNAIINNLFMIMVIYFILFVLLVTYRIQGFGWILGTCASSFFSTILAQIRFRSEIPSHEIVYFESFYFVLYSIVGVLLALSLIGFYTKVFDLQQPKDHLIIKLLYWPITLGMLLLITILYLY